MSLFLLNINNKKVLLHKHGTASALIDLDFKTSRLFKGISQMKKLSSIIVLSALAAPLAFAGNDSLVTSAFAEPVYLSACGIILLAFGMMKNKKDA